MELSRVHLSITDRHPFAAGNPFGSTGCYEMLLGRITVRVAPGSVPPGAIVDLDLAPVDNDGLISCAADIAILKPQYIEAGNRRLLFDYPNRGSKRALQFFNDAPFSNRPHNLDHAGNGFLMRRGYSVVWIAWQGDLQPGDDRLILDLPTARDGETTIRGSVCSEFIVDEPGQRVMPLSGRVSTRSYPVLSLAKREAVFTRQRDANSLPLALAPHEWDFAREETGIAVDYRSLERAIVPSHRHIRLKAGFEPGWIYRLRYQSADPLVIGLGHAVVRDVAHFLKHRDRDDSGAANPLGSKIIEKAYAWGRSQSGRAIRDFIYHGFNETCGWRIFDGAIIHASGAGRLATGRFANLNAPGSQQYEDHANSSDCFPFAYVPCTDPSSGRTDSILARPDSDPLVMHVQTSSEYWQRRGSLVHTTPSGEDLPEADNVRIFHWASAQHSSDPTALRPRRDRFENLSNIVQTSMLFRTLLDALDAWASTGRAPPASAVPRRADGTLVPFEIWRSAFPRIPGVTLPVGPNTFETLPVFVPATDQDGNEIAGVRAPMVAAALGTYTGWNIRAKGHGHGAMHSFNGSYIPFPATSEMARATSDPRRSIAERFASTEAYIAAIGDAAAHLISRGLMLEEDLERVVKEAENWGGSRHDVQRVLASCSLSDSDATPHNSSSRRQSPLDL